jgi:hypothetical protein
MRLNPSPKFLGYEQVLFVIIVYAKVYCECGGHWININWVSKGKILQNFIDEISLALTHFIFIFDNCPGV